MAVICTEGHLPPVVGAHFGLAARAPSRVYGQRQFVARGAAEFEVVVGQHFHSRQLKTKKMDFFKDEKPMLFY